MPRMQFFWHCLPCGQTRPQTAGRAFLDLIMDIPSSYFPWVIMSMNCGMGTSTGQPFWHWRVLALEAARRPANAISSV